ncbi:unnamed protein product [Amoebophrya sp. A25]|nr:unnamed protein product [Amoebophrya sp. A25]|eukprot:GSA25T00025458001.1
MSSSVVKKQPSPSGMAAPALVPRFGEHEDEGPVLVDRAEHDIDLARIDEVDPHHLPEPHQEDDSIGGVVGGSSSNTTGHGSNGEQGDQQRRHNDENRDAAQDHVHHDEEEDINNVFEIRDFTAASPLEKLSRELELIVKSWSNHFRTSAEVIAAAAECKQQAHVCHALGMLSSSSSQHPIPTPSSPSRPLSKSLESEFCSLAESFRHTLQMYAQHRTSQGRMIARFRFNAIKYQLHVYYGRPTPLSVSDDVVNFFYQEPELDHGTIKTTSSINIKSKNKDQEEGAELQMIRRLVQEVVQDGNSKFPVKCHPHTRRFGVRQFLMVTRERESQDIADDSANFILSAMIMAIRSAFPAGGTRDDHVVPRKRTTPEGGDDGEGSGGSAEDARRASKRSKYNNSNAAVEGSKSRPDESMVSTRSRRTSTAVVAASSSGDDPRDRFVDVPCFVCQSLGEGAGGKTIGEGFHKADEKLYLRRRYIAYARRRVDPALRDLPGLVEFWETLRGKSVSGSVASTRRSRNGKGQHRWRWRKSEYPGGGGGGSSSSSTSGPLQEQRAPSTSGPLQEQRSSGSTLSSNQNHHSEQYGPQIRARYVYLCEDFGPSTVAARTLELMQLFCIWGPYSRNDFAGLEEEDEQAVLGTNEDAVTSSGRKHQLAPKDHADRGLAAHLLESEGQHQEGSLAQAGQSSLPASPPTGVPKPPPPPPPPPTAPPREPRMDPCALNPENAELWQFRVTCAEAEKRRSPIRDYVDYFLDFESETSQTESVSQFLGMSSSGAAAVVPSLSTKKGGMGGGGLAGTIGSPTLRSSSRTTTGLLEPQSGEQASGGFLGVGTLSALGQHIASAYQDLILPSDAEQNLMLERCLNPTAAGGYNIKSSQQQQAIEIFRQYELQCAESRRIAERDAETFQKSDLSSILRDWEKHSFTSFRDALETTVPRLHFDAEQEAPLDTHYVEAGKNAKKSTTTASSSPPSSPLQPEAANTVLHENSSSSGSPTITERPYVRTLRALNALDRTLRDRLKGAPSMLNTLVEELVLRKAVVNFRALCTMYMKLVARVRQKWNSRQLYGGTVFSAVGRTLEDDDEAEEVPPFSTDATYKGVDHTGGVVSSEDNDATSSSEEEFEDAAEGEVKDGAALESYPSSSSRRRSASAASNKQLLRRLSPQKRLQIRNRALAELGYRRSKVADFRYCLLHQRLHVIWHCIKAELDIPDPVDFVRSVAEDDDGGRSTPTTSNYAHQVAGAGAGLVGAFAAGVMSGPGGMGSDNILTISDVAEGGMASTFAGGAASSSEDSAASGGTSSNIHDAPVINGEEMTGVGLVQAPSRKQLSTTSAGVGGGTTAPATHLANKIMTVKLYTPPPEAPGAASADDPSSSSSALSSTINGPLGSVRVGTSAASSSTAPRITLATAPLLAEDTIAMKKYALAPMIELQRNPAAFTVSAGQSRQTREDLAILLKIQEQVPKHDCERFLQAWPDGTCQQFVEWYISEGYASANDEQELALLKGVFAQVLCEKEMGEEIGGETGAITHGLASIVSRNKAVENAKEFSRKQQKETSMLAQVDEAGGGVSASTSNDHIMATGSGTAGVVDSSSSSSTNRPPRLFGGVVVPPSGNSPVRKRESVAVPGGGGKKGEVTPGGGGSADASATTTTKRNKSSRPTSVLAGRMQEHFFLDLSLFDPAKEAELSLYYLENVTTHEFWTQIFQVGFQVFVRDFIEKNLALLLRYESFFLGRFLLPLEEELRRVFSVDGFSSFRSRSGSTSPTGSRKNSMIAKEYDQTVVEEGQGGPPARTSSRPAEPEYDARSQGSAEDASFGTPEPSVAGADVVVPSSSSNSSTAPAIKDVDDHESSSNSAAAKVDHDPLASLDDIFNPFAEILGAGETTTTTAEAVQAPPSAQPASSEGIPNASAEPTVLASTTSTAAAPESRRARASKTKSNKNPKSTSSSVASRSRKRPIPDPFASVTETGTVPVPHPQEFQDLGVLLDSFHFHLQLAQSLEAVLDSDDVAARDIILQVLHSPQRLCSVPLSSLASSAEMSHMTSLKENQNPDTASASISRKIATQRRLLEKCFTPFGLQELPASVREFLVEDDRARVYAEIRDSYVRLAANYVSF